MNGWKMIASFCDDLGLRGKLAGFTLQGRVNLYLSAPIFSGILEAWIFGVIPSLKLTVKAPEN